MCQVISHMELEKQNADLEIYETSMLISKSKVNLFGDNMSLG